MTTISCGPCLPALRSSSTPPTNSRIVYFDRNALASSVIVGSNVIAMPPSKILLPLVNRPVEFTLVGDRCAVAKEVATE